MTAGECPSGIACRVQFSSEDPLDGVAVALGPRRALAAPPVAAASGFGRWRRGAPLPPAAASSPAALLRPSLPRPRLREASPPQSQRGAPRGYGGSFGCCPLLPFRAESG